MNNIFEFQRTLKTAPIEAKAEHRVFGRFARVRNNVCDNCYSVDYRDGNGKIVNSNGMTLREANRFARAIESYHLGDITRAQKLYGTVQKRFETFLKKISK